MESTYTYSQEMKEDQRKGVIFHHLSHLEDYSIRNEMFKLQKIQNTLTLKIRYFKRNATYNGIEYIVEETYIDAEHKLYSFSVRKKINEINKTSKSLLADNQLVQFTERSLSKEFQDLQNFYKAKEYTSVKNLPVSMESIAFI